MPTFKRPPQNEWLKSLMPSWLFNTLEQNVDALQSVVPSAMIANRAKWAIRAAKNKKSYGGFGGKAREELNPIEQGVFDTTQQYLIDAVSRFPRVAGTLDKLRVTRNALGAGGRVSPRQTHLKPKEIKAARELDPENYEIFRKANPEELRTWNAANPRKFKGVGTLESDYYWDPKNYFDEIAEAGSPLTPYHELTHAAQGNTAQGARYSNWTNKVGYHLNPSEIAARTTARRQFNRAGGNSFKQPKSYLDDVVAETNKTLSGLSHSANDRTAAQVKKFVDEVFPEYLQRFHLEKLGRQVMWDADDTGGGYFRTIDYLPRGKR